MRLKDAINKLSALRFMVEDLELLSGSAKRVLMDTLWLKEPIDLKKEFDILSEYIESLEMADTAHSRSLLEIKLERVRDIHGTINRLQKRTILDDVEWFEIKSFALLAEEIRTIINKCGIGSISIPDLTPLIRLLDPEGTRIPAFHVYDAYSETLAALRQKAQAIAQDEQHEKERIELFEKINAEEERIRAELSHKAVPHAADAAKALQAIVRADILFAKAKQMQRRGLCIPSIAAPETETVYKSLFHPEVAQCLANEGKRFQTIDFLFGSEPTLITGSNMGGKTVLLNMLALSQYMFQFGFAVPASEASIAPVDDVALCLMQNDGMKRGLSGFAVEMLNIQEAIRLLKAGKRVLTVIDEPAQTTNPPEGTALVVGLVALLHELNARAVITTHYSGINGACRRMRVKGFTAGDNVTITPKNIADYMDYSLTEETESAEAPREALRVAALLGVDEKWLEYARNKLDMR